MADATRRPALVILAAGASERLGTCKALAPLGGPDDTPLARLLAAGRASTDPPPVVVTGRHHDAIVAAAPADIEIIRNADWEAGRSGSVRCAVNARPTHDLLLAPVDVPMVGAEVFAALADEWLGLGAPSRGWLAPTTDPSTGRFGHPIVIGRELLVELATWPADRPLRELRSAAAPLAHVVVSTQEIFDDLDTPEDLARLRSRLDGSGR